MGFATSFTSAFNVLPAAVFSLNAPGFQAIHSSLPSGFIPNAYAGN